MAPVPPPQDNAIASVNAKQKLHALRRSAKAKATDVNVDIFLLDNDVDLSASLIPCRDLTSTPPPAKECTTVLDATATTELVAIPVDHISSEPEEQATSTLSSSWFNAATIGNICTGLVVMLADTDVGCLLTAAQSGVVWGYSLILIQLLLIPVIYMAQDIAVRLGTVMGLSQAELLVQRYGRAPAWCVCTLVVLSCAGAIVSELSGLVGVGKLFGVAPWISVAFGVLFLLSVIFTGSYRRVERIAVFFGLFELVFVITMFILWPDTETLASGIVHVPLHNSSYFYLVAANIGAVVMPWMVYYQQSAVVVAKAPVSHLKSAKWGIFVGACLTQLIMIATLMTTAGASWDGHLPGNGELETVEEFSDTVTLKLGKTWGLAVFSVGMVGAALVAAVVVTLTAAWTLGELTGFKRSLESKPSEAPWLYIVYFLFLAAGAGICLSPINSVALNVFIEVTNAIIIPFVLLSLFVLSYALPPEHQPGPVYRVVMAIIFFICSGLGVAGAVFGIVNGEA